MPFGQHLPISSQPLGTSILLFVSMSSAYFDSSYKWDHTIFFICLTYFISIKPTRSKVPLMLLQIARFLFYNWKWFHRVCVCTYTHNILFIHSSISGHLIFCHVLAVVKYAAVYLGMQIPLGSGLHFLGYTCRSSITGSYASSVLKFLRKVHTIFCKSCTNLHSY